MIFFSRPSYLSPYLIISKPYTKKCHCEESGTRRVSVPHDEAISMENFVPAFFGQMALITDSSHLA